MSRLQRPLLRPRPFPPRAARRSLCRDGRAGGRRTSLGGIRVADALIELGGVHFAYDGAAAVLADADFRLDTGQRTALVGPTGSGKTTLLHLMVGLLHPTAGTIRLFGRERRSEADFADVRGRVGLLFQDAEDQLFCPTVAEDVAFGPLNQGKTHSEAVAIVRETLASLGLSGYEDRVTYRLSGGEKRLVSLATVLAMGPEVLLLDEPTTGLDERTVERIVDILSHLPQAMVIISHHRDFLDRVTDRTVELRDRRLQVCQPPAQ
ncbi:MAG: ABC transporter ATP-binding protein [Planctomycetes bacterium]|nr:ABC transporter ATP-binding protein [Planctomycetota bacterium]